MRDGYVTTRQRPRALHRISSLRVYAVRTYCGRMIEEFSVFGEGDAPDVPACEKCESGHQRRREDIDAVARYTEEHWREVIGMNGETREELVAAGNRTALAAHHAATA